MPVAPSPSSSVKESRKPFPSHPETALCPRAVPVAVVVNASPVAVQSAGTPSSKSARSRSEASGVGSTVAPTVIGASSRIAVPSAFQVVG